MPPRDFPQLSAGGDSHLHAAAVKDHLRNLARFHINWYETRAGARLTVSSTLTLVAIALMMFGGVILALRTLSAGHQKILVAALSKQMTEVPADFGLVAFAIAGIVLAIDRFTNITSNWVRYVNAAMMLDDACLTFETKWTSITAQHEDNPKQRLLQQTSLLESFARSILDAVEHETNEWARSVEQAHSDLGTFVEKKQK